MPAQPGSAAAEWRVSQAPVAYEAALTVMAARAQAIADGHEPELVWLLEHPPLYTAGTSAKQADLLKRTYERAVSNTRELSDLIQRSNGEALDLLNKRFTEAVDEVKSLVEKSGAPKF